MKILFFLDEGVETTFSLSPNSTNSVSSINLIDSYFKCENINFIFYCCYFLYFIKSIKEKRLGLYRPVLGDNSILLFINSDMCFTENKVTCCIKLEA